MKKHFLAVDKNIPFIIVEGTCEHFHQCRFPGSVLSNQGMNLSSVYLEIHAIHCNGTWKPLDYLPHFKGKPDGTVTHLFLPATNLSISEAQPCGAASSLGITYDFLS